jgi:AAA domain
VAVEPRGGRAAHLLLDLVEAVSRLDDRVGGQSISNDHQMRAHRANGMIEVVGSTAGLHKADNGKGRDIGGVVPRPALFERLGSAARVTVVSAPAGSGKTVLLRSWIAGAGLAGRAAWVAAGRGERDPQRFWLSVLGALRQTGPGAGQVRAVSPAPDLDGWTLAEGLLSDLAPLNERLWLVIDDVHELHPDALRQLQLLIIRAPAELRFVLTARHDVQLGLHRLRLEGGPGGRGWTAGGYRGGSPHAGASHPP